MADKRYGIILSAKDETRAAFDSAKRNIESMEAPLLSVKNAIGAFAGGLVMTTLKNLSDQYLESAISVNKLAAVLHSTGYAAGLTAAELEDLVQQTSRLQLIDDEQVRDGVSALLLFRNVQGDVAKEAIRLGAEMTQLGGDMSSAMQQIGSALESPLDASKKLRAMGVFLTENQKDLIKTMTEAGDVAGAQGVILEALNKKYGDLSATMNTGAIADSKRLKIAWDELLETLGKAPAESGVSGWLATQLERTKWLVENLTTANGLRIMFLGNANESKQRALWETLPGSAPGSSSGDKQAQEGLRLKAQQDMQDKLDLQRTQQREKFQKAEEEYNKFQIEQDTKAQDENREAFYANEVALSNIRAQALEERQAQEQAYHDWEIGVYVDSFNKKIELQEKGKAAMANQLAVAGTQFRVFFEINKAYRTAEAVIAGWDAVQSSYAFGAKWGGPVGGAAMAAIAFAATAANIAAIQGASFGGGSGAHGAGGGSGGAPLSTPSPLAPEPQSMRGQTLVTINFGDAVLLPVTTVRNLIEQINEAIGDGAVIKTT